MYKKQSRNVSNHTLPLYAIVNKFTASSFEIGPLRISFILFQYFVEIYFHELVIFFLTPTNICITITNVKCIKK